MNNDFLKDAGLRTGIKAIGTWFKARQAYSAAKKGVKQVAKGINPKLKQIRAATAETARLQTAVAKKNILPHFFGKIKAPKPKTAITKIKPTSKSNIGAITGPSTNVTEPVTQQKYTWKGLAGAGAAGFVGAKLLGGSEPEVKYASVGTAIGKLLKHLGNRVPNKGAAAVGKAILGTGTAGLGGGLVAGYVLGNDGHDASSHGHKKTAEEMDPKEKADQKYAIAKSYEKEGHSDKSKEYKDKASKAYKKAWEKKSEYLKFAGKESLIENIIQGLAAGTAGAIAGGLTGFTIAKLNADPNNIDISLKKKSK